MYTKCSNNMVSTGQAEKDVALAEGKRKRILFM